MGQIPSYQCGVYKVTYADGSTAGIEGYGHQEMLAWARENGAVGLTAPSGQVFDDGDIAISGQRDTPHPESTGPGYASAEDAEIWG